MKIIYNNKELQLKYGIREQIMFNNISGKLFKAETLFDDFIMYYCCVSVAYGEKVDVNKFADFVDEHNDYFIEFMEWLTNDIFTDKK